LKPKTAENEPGAAARDAPPVVVVSGAACPRGCSRHRPRGGANRDSHELQGRAALLWVLPSRTTAAGKESDVNGFGRIISVFHKNRRGRTSFDVFGSEISGRIVRPGWQPSVAGWRLLPARWNTPAKFRDCVPQYPIFESSGVPEQLHATRADGKPRGATLRATSLAAGEQSFRRSLGNRPIRQASHASAPRQIPVRRSGLTNQVAAAEDPRRFNRNL